MVSSKKLNEQIKDEVRSAKQYRKQGYPNLAKDETRHARFLRKEKRKLNRK